MTDLTLASVDAVLDALVRDARASESDAVERVLTHHPRWRKFWRGCKGFRRADARIVIAAEHGYTSWDALDEALRGGVAVAAPETSENPYFEVVDRMSIKAERLRWGSIMTALPGRRPLENRGKPVGALKLAALIRGLEHDNPVVRWQCLEHLDTHPDATAVPHIVACLDDPVPRVRWHAVHALACDACKLGESWVSGNVETRLLALAREDSNERVREYARSLLRDGAPGGREGHRPAGA